MHWTRWSCLGAWTRPGMPGYDPVQQQHLEDCQASMFCQCMQLQGVCALTITSQPCHLAVPAAAETGSIRVCDANEGAQILAEIGAHKSPLVCLSSGLAKILILETCYGAWAPRSRPDACRQPWPGATMAVCWHRPPRKGPCCEYTACLR